MVNVFVYGTLKKGFALHGHMQSKQIQFLGEGTLDQVNLLHLGWYPGVVEGDGQVTGEVYTVPDTHVRKLDMVEGSPFLFKRETRKISMAAPNPGAAGPEVEAEVYYYQRAKGDEEVLKTGVWK